ncbi:MAG: glycerol-3-phosphate 1-O-acyltransferase PlsY [Bacteroidales bacterium]|nr:glycerol-3-phosphate 1-O-acyltransferase PlsY [Bacteroidales bacterium]
MFILKIIIAPVLAYLIGSIPTSVWIGRIFYGLDIRTHGSGNAGATNTIRVLGAKAGIPVLIFDIFKGWFAVYITNFFWIDQLTDNQFVNFKIIMAIAAVIGHIFPVYVGFKGGKGIAALLGIGIALYPWAVLIVIGVFLIVLIIFKYVSLASIISAISFPFIEIFLLHNNKILSLMLLSITIAIFVPITHKKNIKRLLKKKEAKFKFKKQNTK